MEVNDLADKVAEVFDMDGDTIQWLNMFVSQAVNNRMDMDAGDRAPNDYDEDMRILSVMLFAVAVRLSEEHEFDLDEEINETTEMFDSWLDMLQEEMEEDDNDDTRGFY